MQITNMSHPPASPQPLVSVVTPVHNTADFLAACIESVIKQRYTNWEYIVVDNASSDGSYEIAESYARQDARIRVLRYDELVPQVPNYNRALRAISRDSRYVKVVEADNWLDKDCLERMVELAEACPSVGIVGSYNITEHRIRFIGLRPSQQVILGRDVVRAHLKGESYLFGAPTTVLMRADLVRARDCFYDESHVIAEDLSACYDALRDSDFGFVHQVLTFVRTENESILSKIRTFRGQALDRLVLFHRHGKDFFSQTEYGRTEKLIQRHYYSELAGGILENRSNRFWAFHRRGIDSVGLRLDIARLSAALLLELARRAAHPVSALLKTFRT